MRPYGLKTDKHGLLYIDSKDIPCHEYLSLDKRNDKNEFYASYFYRIFGVEDYIIKQTVTVLDRKERQAYENMLMELVNRQKNVIKTEFPIGYLRDRKKLAALIIRYYKNGISFDNVIKEKDINLISKYYLHDEDSIRNLFMIFDEVLYALYEMFENGIYYTDIFMGNFVIDDNQVKIIDFDPVYVTFKNKDEKLAVMLERYFRTIGIVLNNYGLSFEHNSFYSEIASNFEEAKELTKRIENGVRRNK